MDSNQTTELRLKLLAAGYDPLPCAGKAALLDGWTTIDLTPDLIREWPQTHPASVNTGIRCGHAIGIDIDITDAALSERVKNLALQMLGDTTLVRIGRAPKQLLVYRTETPARKKSVAAGKGKGAHKVEILGEGNQFIAYGTHPDTAQPYVWPEQCPLDVPLHELPLVTEEALVAFLDAVAPLIGVPERPQPQPEPHKAPLRANGHAPGTREPTDAEEAVEALYAIPAASLDYSEWVRVGFALHAALGPAGVGHYEAWSATDPARFKPGEPSSKFAGFIPRDIEAGTLFYIAAHHGWAGGKSRLPPISEAGIFKRRRTESGESGVFNQETGEFTPELAEIAVSDAFPFDPAAIPKRNWVVPGLLLRKYLSVLVAPPGTGKSLIVLQIAIAVALGRAWGGWTPRAPAKVLIVNSEDDLDEMRRRLHAACEAMDVHPAELKGIYLADTPEDMVIVSRSPRGEIRQTGLAGRIAATCQRLGIEFIAVDPMSETHQLDENSNADIKEVGKAWRQVARDTGAAVLLVHHTPKRSGGMAGDPDAARGGSALVGVARIVSTLFAMTEEEAATLGVEEDKRREFVRFDDAKANYSLLSDKKWLQKKTFVVPNGGMGMDGDQVGALIPWSVPGVFDGIPMTAVHGLLKSIDAGLDTPTGRALYGARRNTGARYIVDLIEARLGIPTERAKSILLAWTKSGLLHEKKYGDGHQERTGFGVDPTKLSEILHGV